MPLEDIKTQFLFFKIKIPQEKLTLKQNNSVDMSLKMALNPKVQIRHSSALLEFTP